MFKMGFDFKDREPEELRRVNEALSAMPLKGLEIEENDGYMSVRTSYDTETRQPIGKTYMYGFDHLVLNCDCNWKEDAHFYQIDAQAFPKGEIGGSEAYRMLWSADHPGRVMRLMQVIEFNSSNAEAYVVLHHERA